jgi:hypothetical protein
MRPRNLTVITNGRVIELRDRQRQGCKSLKHVKCTHWVLSLEKEKPIPRVHKDRWFIVL